MEDVFFVTCILIGYVELYIVVAPILQTVKTIENRSVILVFPFSVYNTGSYQQKGISCKCHFVGKSLCR